MRLFLRYFTIVLIVTIALVSGSLYVQHRKNDKYISIGEDLIEKIETYKSINKKLPETLNDLNEPESMENGPYYDKIDDNQYEVSFCFGFDDDLTYNSNTKKWTGTMLSVPNK